MLVVIFCLMVCGSVLTCFLFFFFNDTATTEIYTLSLHDALPISAIQPIVREAGGTFTDWQGRPTIDRKSTRLNSSHLGISYAVFCLKKKNRQCRVGIFSNARVVAVSNMLKLVRLARVEYSVLVFFFFNDTATTEIYTLSLHDALPIFLEFRTARARHAAGPTLGVDHARSEEHTSELQSLRHLVCRLLLEKKKKKQ